MGGCGSSQSGVEEEGDESIEMEGGFDALLRDDITREVFRKHLKNEYCAENLSFWEHTEKFAEDFDESEPDSMEDWALMICGNYIHDSAEFQINITDEAKERIQEVATGEKEPHSKTFSLANREVYAIMQTDAYPRFLKSPLWERHRAMQQQNGKKKSMKGMKKKKSVSPRSSKKPASSLK